MKRIMCWLRRLPIIWKLMIGATLLISLVFALYNFAQYIVLEQWMMKQEQDSLHTMMSQVQAYLEDKTDLNETLKLPETTAYMRDILGQDQMIRMIGQTGTQLLLVTKHFEPTWITPVLSESTFLEDVWHGEEHILILRSPFKQNTAYGTIEITTNLETFEHFSGTLLWVMVVGGFLAICISALSGWAIANQFLRPVKALAEAIQNVKQKGLQERVANLKNGDEISELARLFNELMDQLEASFRQQQQFVDDASHELRTPITILEGHLNMLNRWGKTDPAVLDESLTASLLEVRRIKGLVQDLLALTRVESSSLSDHIENIQIDPFLNLTKSRAETLYQDFTFKVSLEQKGTVVRMNPLHLEQLLFIVIENAVKYSGGRRLIHMASHTENRLVDISVQDHGIGIPAAELPYVFDRFYRVDKARNRKIEGTGLGLSIAKNLIRLYEGNITITSVENEGTRVTLTLPIASKP